uniref:Calcium-binding protein n=1 Tax=Streptomyces sp. NBC_00180 TaxID=2903632 RepID=A0AAU1IBU4_9ACTN
MTTGNGTDSIVAGAGDDTVNAGNGTNSVQGDDGNDQLTTGTGTDSIQGGNGNDTIRAGTGTNTVNGGPGTDQCTPLGTQCETLAPLTPQPLPPNNADKADNIGAAEHDKHTPRASSGYPTPTGRPPPRQAIQHKPVQAAPRPEGSCAAAGSVTVVRYLRPPTCLADLSDTVPNLRIRQPRSTARTRCPSRARCRRQAAGSHGERQLRPSFYKVTGARPGMVSRQVV